MNRYFRGLVALLLAPCLTAEPVHAFVGAGSHPCLPAGRPARHDIAGRHGDLPLQFFASQALAEPLESSIIIGRKAAEAVNQGATSFLRPEVPSAFSPASDLDHEISTVLINVVNLGKSVLASGVLQVLSSFLSQHPTLEVKLLSLQGKEAFSEKVLAGLRGQGIEAPERNVRFIEADFKQHLLVYHYLRDLFVMDHDRLILPNNFRHFEFKEDLLKLADALGFKAVQSDLVFERGNMLFTRDFLFIGNYVLLSNLKANPTAEQIDAVKQRFEQFFGKKVIVIGETYEDQINSILFHIDNILTPIGGNQVLLADPRWGARLLKHSTAEEFLQLEQTLFDRRRFWHEAGLLDDSLLSVQQSRGSDQDIYYGRMFLREAAARRRASDYKVLEEYSEWLAIQLDRFEKQLQSQSILVAGRLPLVPIMTDRQFSFNNAQLERFTTREGGRIQRVNLPMSGLPVPDQAAIETFRRLGFEAVPILGGYELMVGRGSGGLHCVTQELRKPPAPFLNGRLKQGT